MSEISETRVREIVREEIHGNKGLVQRLNEAEAERDRLRAELDKAKLATCQDEREQLIAAVKRQRAMESAMMEMLKNRDAEIERLTEHCRRLSNEIGERERVLACRIKTADDTLAANARLRRERDAARDEIERLREIRAKKGGEKCRTR